jgi:hypothetical protein
MARDWKTVSEEEIYTYVVLALFMLTCIPQNPTIKIVFKKGILL